MIQATDVTKRYGATLALDRLTLSVPQGAVFGLLGPNGAGKSTLIKLLMGFCFPDRGHIDLGGISPAQVGYVAERPVFSPRSSVRGYLTTIGKLGGLRGGALRQAVDRNLRQVGMSDAARFPIAACSKGMLQRVALAQALLGEPPLVLLDEPLGGLDPAWQKTTRDLIKHLPREGKTVLVSTHQLSDVAEVCTHVGILRKGRLVRVGSMEEVLPLRDQVNIKVDHLAESDCVRLTGLHPDIHVNDKSIVLSGQAVALKREVQRMLLDANVDIQHLSQERATLEEIYLEAMRS